MDLHAVRYTVSDRVATVTLDRPERLNAWTGRMHTEYRWCLAEAEADPSVRVVVVTGAGRGFCAGADFRALEKNVAAGGYDDGVREELATPGYGVRSEFDHAFAFHYGMATPVIAAVNGPAAGVGLVLACYCDLRFAAAGAKLTTSAPRLGLPAEYGLSWVLPPDELLPFTYDYARSLAHDVSPSSLRETKRQIYGDLHGDVGSAVERSVELTDEMMGGADYAEGVRAWTERRNPDFPDPG